MTRKTTALLTIAAALVLITAANPANAGGYVGFEVSNHGVSLGFGASNWGIWGSSWNTGSASVGFSASLSGYGEWIHVDGLGRVWRPWVAAGWQPFTHGRWMWTSLGWTWVAYEPWGWVPHHYGNWAFSTIGWVWTPGYAYHPGNVVWASTGVHVGWYPCAPHGWSHSHRGYHHGWRDGYSNGYADGWRDARYATWVPRSRVTAENIAHHAVGHETATNAVARSRVTAMSGSPTRTQIEGYVGRPVPEARIAERKATVDGREIRLVRPEGQERTVQRHAASTVEHALNSEARPRVSSGGTIPVRHQDAAGAKTNDQTRPSTRAAEPRKYVDEPRPTRSTNPRSRSDASALRELSESKTSSHGRTAPVSAGRGSSAIRKRSTTATTRQTREPQVSTTRTRSVTGTDPPEPTDPKASKQRSTREVPEATTRSDVQRKHPREKIVPASHTKSKRSRSGT